MNKETNRREFEKWADRKVIPTEKDSQGYFSRYTQVAWEAWQAARERQAVIFCDCGNPSQHITGWHSNLCWDCKKPIEGLPKTYPTNQREDMKLFFKRLFCRHTLAWVRNIHGDEINATGCRTVWICEKCGKYIYDKDYITRDMACVVHNNQPKEPTSEKI
jgi:hypothetical protein